MNKNKFMENIGLKIIALIFAIVLWMIVVNVDNPVKMNTYRNIPVTITNTEIVTNRGKTYKVIDDTSTVTVIVKAKRSDMAKLTADKIVAEADLSDMQFESLVPITVTIPGFSGEYTAEATPANLKVKIEDRTKKVFPITVSMTGTPRDGYVVASEEASINPEKVEVKGSESIVSSIDSVIAKVDVSGISKDEDLPAELLFYDKEGNLVNRSLLSDNIGDEGITVSVKVLTVKNVGIKIKHAAEPNEETEELSQSVYKFTCEPSTVQVCGRKEDVQNFKEIEIPLDHIDHKNEEGKHETTIDISTYLPEGIKLVDPKANNIVVTVLIEKEGTKTIEYQVESIKIENLSDLFKVSFEDEVEVNIQLAGPQEELDKINLNEAVSIDMKNNINPGVYEIPVRVDLTGAKGVSLVEKPYVKVTLTEKKR